MSSSAAVDSVRRLGIDVVEIRPRADSRVDIVAVVGGSDRARLAAFGVAAADVPRSPEAAALEAQRALRGAAAFTVYRDFDDPVRGVAAYLRSLAATHNNIRVDSIGASVEGRPLLIAKIGVSTDDPNRPNVLFMATYHAREWAATEMALRLLTYLADSLPNLPAAQLLNARDIWVLPVANPDGYQYTFSVERLWRKNRSRNADGSYGVDLNRNHNGFWGFNDVGSSGMPQSEVYRGTSVFSEPETRAIEAFHRAYPPVTSVSYHTYTGAILYPWSHANGIRTGDDAIFRALAGTDATPAIADSIPNSVNSYYHPGPGWHLYTTNGDYTSYAYRAFRTAAFTVELTSGCCQGGQYYGFDFPDSEPLLERMFRDNLPFALGLIAASANLTQSVVAPGAAPASRQLESVWPELRALIDAPSSPTGAAVDVALDSGIVALRLAPRDTLGFGRRYVRVSTGDPTVADQRATRLPTEGLAAEILLRDGAEQHGTGWTGFRRGSPGFLSTEAWMGYTDTLTSPPIGIAGRSNLALYFWTRHLGSVFTQQARGRVEIQTDNGAWTPVTQIVGAAPEWYPVATPLPAVGTSLRVRFVASAMDWWVDAVSVAADDATVIRLFAPRALPAPQIDVSANPVRAAPVTLRWIAGTGTARIDVFSLTGTRIASVSLPADPGRWQWDLTTDSGHAVANGQYFVVLTLGSGTSVRRRLLVAR